VSPGAAESAEHGEHRRRRFLVTGAAGFIGSHLCDRLLAEGHVVWGLDNFDAFYPPEMKRSNLAAALSDPHMHLVEGDIRDGILLDGLFGDVPFDGVIHLAARAGVRPSIEDPRLCFDVNLTGTLALLEAMHRHHVGRFVFGSSSSVYGETAAVPFSEDTAADRPISPYAASKRAGELLCHTYHHLYGLSVICLRFFTVYGPRQRPDLAIHKFARLMAAGRRIPVYGDGSSSRDYTYIDDIIDGVVRAADRLDETPVSAPTYEVINLGNSQPVHLRDMVDGLTVALGIAPQIERLPDQPGDVSTTFASVTRAEAKLGYRPGIPFSEGLRRFADWFAARSNGIRPNVEAAAE